MTVTSADLARTLVERRRAAALRTSRRAGELRVALAETLATARERGIIDRAWLIGSLARGAYGPGSDVDVVVEGLALEDSGALWGELVERLRTDRVDLLRLEELPETFRRRVLEEGEPLR